jgi:hypothetical protein
MTCDGLILAAGIIPAATTPSFVVVVERGKQYQALNDSDKDSLSL